MSNVSIYFTNFSFSIYLCLHIESLSQLFFLVVLRVHLMVMLSQVSVQKTRKLILSKYDCFLVVPYAAFINGSFLCLTLLSQLREDNMCVCACPLDLHVKRKFYPDHIDFYTGLPFSLLQLKSVNFFFPDCTDLENISPTIHICILFSQMKPFTITCIAIVVETFSSKV